ncbi:hypothetical protein [Rhizobium sp. SL86]|uniref:hypothetical protein n=1 Tax=Rhizobium sp. SL86 TaxID=2995148 RepID=UPI00227691CB|nr:hypothetical protein [Rhizobium sp. SL86]MCY1669387.1 hypothetical protein [Rhizobium sp. SL86]
MKSIELDPAVATSAGYPAQIELVALARTEGPAAPALDGVAHVPQPRTRAWWTRHGLFLIVFLLPVFVGTVYFGFVASDVYVSESKFILRTPGKMDGPLSSFGQGQVSARSDDDAYALIEFIKSRDAARTMERDHGMRDIMGRPEADVFSRYPAWWAKDNQENYFKAYRQHISVEMDGVTGIVTLVARAYRPNDAINMANSLLQISEIFVNGLSARSNRDAENFARSFLAQSQLELVNVEADLSAYRNTQSVLDPSIESEATLSQIGKMAGEITRMEAALGQQRSLAPNSPSVKPLTEQIRAYREQLSVLRKTVVGDPESAVSKMKDYELLTLKRDIAAKKIAFAAAQFEKTRQDAQNQRIYLQRVVEPGLPDVPALPYRILMVLGIAILSFAAFSIVKSMVSATMEHKL